MQFSTRLARYARRVLLVFAVLLTVAAVAVFIINLRGASLWRECKASYAAKGVDLERVPQRSTIPEERNFMRTPELQKYMFMGGHPPAFQEMIGQLLSSRNDDFTWREGRRCDLKKIVESQNRLCREAKPQSASEVRDSTMEEVYWSLDMHLAKSADFRQRLRSRLVTANESELFHLDPIRKDRPWTAAVAQFLFVRPLMYTFKVSASRALIGGDSEEAFLDSLCALRICRGMISAPDSTCLDVGIGIVAVSTAMQALWEGTRSHAWREHQLSLLQLELDKTHSVEGVRRAFANEIYPLLKMHDTIRTPFISRLKSSENKYEIGYPWPTGWIDESKVYVVKFLMPYGDMLEKAYTPDCLKRLSDVQTEAKNWVDGYRWYKGGQFIAFQMTPDFGKMLQTSLRAEAYVQLAKTACALERWRLVKGGYPETLKELVPQYMAKEPLDPVNGEGLRYWKNGDKSYVLFSVGLDGVSQEGKVPAKKDEEAVDWVWPEMR